MSVDEGSGATGDAGEAPAQTDAPGLVQRYRFRVRTADGRELTSAVASVRLPPRLRAPQWSHSSIAPGEKATMRVQAPGRDGEKIHFVIERRRGDSWEPIGNTTGDIQNGMVEVEHEMPHLPPDEVADADPDSAVEYHSAPETGGEAGGEGARGEAAAAGDGGAGGADGGEPASGREGGSSGEGP